MSTCRDHHRYVADLEESQRDGFRRGTAPLAFEPLLIHAPFFNWTMVKLDWQQAMDLGILSYEIGEVVWSMLPSLARAATNGKKSDRETGFVEFKRRLREYYVKMRVDSKIPLKRFTLNKIKAKKYPVGCHNA